MTDIAERDTATEDAEHPRAKFKSFEESTAEDWAIITPQLNITQSFVADRVIQLMRDLQFDHGGFPVDRLEHSLQTATRAERDGRDDEYVLCALLHDIGDTLGSFNHADIGAAIVKPFVDDSYHWMVEQHAIFQGYYFFHFLGLDRDMRDRFEGHPYYDLTAEFCADFDGPAFEPNYPTMPLDEFVPLLHQFFAAPKRSIYKRDDG